MAFSLLLISCLGCSDQSTSESAEEPIPRTTNAINPTSQKKQNEETARTYAEFQDQLRRLLSRAGGTIANMETVTSGDVTVETVADLIEALSSAQIGETVFIRGSARLDLTKQGLLVVPPGVRLASDRGADTSSGAFLYTNDLSATLFKAGDGASFVGLNLMGPDPERRGYQMQWLFEEQGAENIYRVPTATGIEVEGDNVRIENCEIWGWSRAGVAFEEGSKGGVVRHSFFHHNRRRGLGYGVSVDASEALIESNLFDWCRHAVASTGRPGSGYEARYNFVLENANGHSFDVHGGADREDGTNTAGSWAKIHHNIVVQTTHPAISIRGLPLEEIEIHTNKFAIEDPSFAVRLRETSERIVVSENEYGAKIMR